MRPIEVRFAVLMIVGSAMVGFSLGDHFAPWNDDAENAAKAAALDAWCVAGWWNDPDGQMACYLEAAQNGTVPEPRTIEEAGQHD